MGRRSRSRALGVWTNGLKVGRWLIPASGPMEFAYDPAWVASDDARPLSLSLPINLDGIPIRGDRVGNFFDNLLPDSEEIRRRIKSRFHTPAGDSFSLLEAVGRDCVGAVQLLPEGKTPEGVFDIDASVLDDYEVEKLLLGAVSGPGLSPGGEDDFRISIAGAQEKTAFTRHRGRWCKPHGATPTTHIFKLPLGLIGRSGLDALHADGALPDIFTGLYTVAIGHRAACVTVISCYPMVVSTSSLRLAAVLHLAFLAPACSSCSVWDECDPGVEQSCSYDGCGTCGYATQTCKNNHEWSECNCISRDYCAPGDERSCGYGGCLDAGDCMTAVETCGSDHQWGQCQCTAWMPEDTGVVTDLMDDDDFNDDDFNDDDFNGDDVDDDDLDALADPPDPDCDSDTCPDLPADLIDEDPEISDGTCDASGDDDGICDASIDGAGDGDGDGDGDGGVGDGTSPDLPEGEEP